MTTILLDPVALEAASRSLATAGADVVRAAASIDAIDPSPGAPPAVAAQLAARLHSASQLVRRASTAATQQSRQLQVHAALARLADAGGLTIAFNARVGLLAGGGGGRGGRLPLASASPFRGVNWWDLAGELPGKAWDEVVKHPGTVGHAALDTFGQLPGLGDVGGDLVNGFWYAAEGNATDAAISLVGVLPYVGNATTGGRGLTKLKAAAEATEAAVKKGTKQSERAVKKAGQKQTFDPPGKNLPSEGFHYTRSEIVESIERHGLRPGAFVTPKGDLSPLQAQIDLALPPNRGLPGATIRVDLAKMRQDGKAIPPEFTLAGRMFRMPGGGQEMQISGKIDPKYLTVVRR